jgi:transaldolase
VTSNPTIIARAISGSADYDGQLAVLAAVIAQGVDDAQATLERLAGVGIDLADVARVLEAEGVAAFTKSYDGLLSLLQARAVAANAS